jgi:predicted TIM-barrel enzyme
MPRATSSCLVKVSRDAVVAGGDAAGIAVDVFCVVVVAETVGRAQNVVGPLCWSRVA